LSEGRLAESVSIIFLLFKVKLFEIINEGLHADKIILENGQAGFTSFWNGKAILVVDNLPEILSALAGKLMGKQVENEIIS
jgi:hypothetical protein